MIAYAENKWSAEVQMVYSEALLYITFVRCNYIDVIMITMASQIASPTVVYSIVYSGADKRKHQRSASLAFVRGKSPHKGPETRKMFPFDDVIMGWQEVITDLLLTLASFERLVVVGNGLSPFRCQAVTSPNADLLSNGPLRTNFSEIQMEISNLLIFIKIVFENVVWEMASLLPGIFELIIWFSGCGGHRVTVVLCYVVTMIWLSVIGFHKWYQVVSQTLWWSW